MTLEELIAALEKGTGPDRWCDANIYMMAHGQTMEIFGGNIVSNGHSVIGWLDPGKANVNFTPSGIGQNIPRYTESIDAAMTLLREEEIELTNLYGVARATVHNSGDYGPSYGSDECGSLAIALCIAALRAIQAKEG